MVNQHEVEKNHVQLQKVVNAATFRAKGKQGVGCTHYKRVGEHEIQAWHWCGGTHAKFQIVL